MKDLNQVFENCILYNGTQSEIGRICEVVKRKADAYSREIRFDRMIAAVR